MAAHKGFEDIYASEGGVCFKYTVSAPLLGSTNHDGSVSKQQQQQQQQQDGLGGDFLSIDDDNMEVSAWLLSWSMQWRSK